ncbi:MAG: hypothetical protein R2710_03600 [Acidimicrobiales bacterium]
MAQRMVSHRRRFPLRRGGLLLFRRSNQGCHSTSGENISSFEVENEVTAHPDVREAAAIAVPSDLGEDEVMIVVAPVEGHTIDCIELFHFLEPRMAHFMLPRYIRVVDELPKTPTQKVQKVVLKGDGLTATTWDREAAGIVIKRERIGT